LREIGTVSVNEHMLRLRVVDAGNDYEIMLFPDGRAIVKGTPEPGVARTLYARYLGT
jgi:adenylyltransferase/sulfurtransferase